MKPGPATSTLRDARIGGQRGDDALGQLARRALARLREQQRDVAREVAVRGVARALDRELAAGWRRAGTSLPASARSAAARSVAIASFTEVEPERNERASLRGLAGQARKRTWVSAPEQRAPHLQLHRIDVERPAHAARFRQRVQPGRPRAERALQLAAARDWSTSCARCRPARRAIVAGTGPSTLTSCRRCARSRSRARARGRLERPIARRRLRRAAPRAR